MRAAPAAQARPRRQSNTPLAGLGTWPYASLAVARLTKHRIAYQALEDRIVEVAFSPGYRIVIDSGLLTYQPNEIGRAHL